MPRFSVFTALTLCLLLVGCEDVADTLRDNKQVQDMVKTGQVSIFRREF
jgi:hypothetical protein